MEQTTECRFVPGETYKDYEGKYYRFVAIDRFNNKALFYKPSLGAYVERHLNGRVYPGGCATDDIIPPKRTLVQWAYVYRPAYQKQPVLVACSDEGTAKTSARIIREDFKGTTIIRDVFKLEVDLDND